MRENPTTFNCFVMNIIPRFTHSHGPLVLCTALFLFMIVVALPCSGQSLQRTGKVSGISNVIAGDSALAPSQTQDAASQPAGASFRQTKVGEDAPEKSAREGDNKKPKVRLPSCKICWFPYSRAFYS
jgi:hypothetical protein